MSVASQNKLPLFFMKRKHHLKVCDPGDSLRAAHQAGGSSCCSARFLLLPLFSSAPPLPQCFFLPLLLVPPLLCFSLFSSLPNGTLGLFFFTLLMVLRLMELLIPAVFSEERLSDLQEILPFSGDEILFLCLQCVHSSFAHLVNLLIRQEGLLWNQDFWLRIEGPLAKEVLRSHYCVIYMNTYMNLYE